MEGDALLPVEGAWIGLGEHAAHMGAEDPRERYLHSFSRGSLKERACLVTLAFHPSPQCSFPGNFTAELWGQEKYLNP